MVRMSLGKIANDKIYISILEQIVFIAFGCIPFGHCLRGSFIYLYRMFSRLKRSKNQLLCHSNASTFEFAGTYIGHLSSVTRQQPMRSPSLPISSLAHPNYGKIGLLCYNFN